MLSVSLLPVGATEIVVLASVTKLTLQPPTGSPSSGVPGSPLPPVLPEPDPDPLDPDPDPDPLDPDPDPDPLDPEPDPDPDPPEDEEPSIASNSTR